MINSRRYQQVLRRHGRKALEPQMLRKALAFVFWQVFGHQEYRRFVVLTRSRTGSNMLISMLESHPSMRAKGERFRHLRGRSVASVLKSIFHRYPWSVRAVGFKIMYYHPHDDESGRIWETLKNLEDLHVIHLKRKNILRTVVSHQIATKTGVWVEHRGDAIPANGIPLEQRQLLLSAETLQHEFANTRQQETTFERLFADQPSLEVFYEDLHKDPLQEFRRITDFLGVEFRAPRTTLSKQNPEKLHDLVVNYEALKRVFALTEWAPLFEE